MTFTEAAAEVLRLAGKPLHYKEITELAIEKNLLSHVGKSPEITMGARLAALLKKDDKTNAIVRVKPGVFALRDWESKKGKRGAAKSDEAGAEIEAEAEADVPSDDESNADLDVNALEVEAVTREADRAERGSPSQPLIFAGHGTRDQRDTRDSRDQDDDDAPSVVSGDDQVRADLAASGAELFDDEDDDDQPILSPAGSAAAGGPAGAAGPDSGADGGRRRRRRRRRGRGGDRPEGGVEAQPRSGGVPQDRASTPRLDGGNGKRQRQRSDHPAGHHLGRRRRSGRRLARSARAGTAPDGA